jgi:hypothetical protein
MEALFESLPSQRLLRQASPNNFTDHFTEMHTAKAGRVPDSPVAFRHFARSWSDLVFEYFQSKKTGVI